MAAPQCALSDESKRVIRDILQSKTQDGEIDLDELGDCLQAFGFDPDDEDVEFLQKHFDDNEIANKNSIFRNRFPNYLFNDAKPLYVGDGMLEVHELVDNIDVINYHSFYGKELMTEFLRIDQDRDGVIRFPEMLKFLLNHETHPLPPLEARRLLDKLARMYDANFDGKFSYAEFVKIYMSDELPYKSDLDQGITKVPDTATKPVKPATQNERPKTGKQKRRIAKKKPAANDSTAETNGVVKETVPDMPVKPERPKSVWQRLSQPDMRPKTTQNPGRLKSSRRRSNPAIQK